MLIRTAQSTATARIIEPFMALPPEIVARTERYVRLYYRVTRARFERVRTVDEIFVPTRIAPGWLAPVKRRIRNFRLPPAISERTQTDVGWQGRLVVPPCRFLTELPTCFRPSHIFIHRNRVI